MQVGCRCRHAECGSCTAWHNEALLAALAPLFCHDLMAGLVLLLRVHSVDEEGLMYMDLGFEWMLIGLCKTH